ncbi:MAG: hypothetical protein K5893_00890 [Prevotella sp.]|nr:hypothetical protein [Prevotella sp.]
MKRTLLKTVLLLFVALMPSVSWAQDNVEGDIQLDLTSKNLWRGLTLGGPSIQPKAEVRWKGLYLNAEGATSFDSNDRERIGVQLGYRAPFGLNVGFGSQWLSGFDDLNRYFHFEDHETGHHFEANLGYTCRYFSLQAYTTLLGNDFNVDDSEKRCYSTYVELAVPFRLGGIDWQARAGITPFESSSWREAMVVNNKDEKLKQFLYADGFTCVQAVLRATKDLHVAGYELPVYVELNTNPYTEKAAIMAGITLKPFQKHNGCCKKK